MGTIVRTRAMPLSYMYHGSVTTAAPLHVPMLDFSRQFSTIREEVMEAIAAVCESQKFVLGPAVSSFEQAAAEACHAKFGVGCASGTDALWLALAGSGVRPADLVVTTPFSFFATASAILRCGATPVFADIDPESFNLSPSAANAAIVAARNSHPESKVAAILPVHLYGQCADWEALTALKEKFSLSLVEDAAQAFGAAWRGTPAGSLGDAAAFSFYPTKNLSAFGDAGLVTTGNAGIADRAQLLRAHGMRRRYVHEEVGWNSRLDSIQAAVLQVKLRYLPAWNAARVQCAANYDSLFTEAGRTGRDTTEGVVLPIRDPRASHVFHQYVIRAPRRDALRQFLTERQIGTEIYYPIPLHLQSSLAYLGYKQGDFSVTEKAASEVLALPIYPELREEEQHAVVDAIVAFYAAA